jgi:hypothetical protein
MVRVGFIVEGDSEKIVVESADKPWDRLKELSNALGKQGPGNKTAFAKKMTKHFGFSIRQAASHPQCRSAQELVHFFTTQR